MCGPAGLNATAKKVFELYAGQSLSRGLSRITNDVQDLRTRGIERSRVDAVIAVQVTQTAEACEKRPPSPSFAARNLQHIIHALRSCERELDVA